MLESKQCGKPKYSSNLPHMEIPQELRQDSVDRILAQWAEQRPDLDFAPVGVITRLARLRNHLDAALVQVFHGFGLSPADFMVIVMLRRVGSPYRLPQTRLMTDLGLTSGTISVRLGRLERMDVVRRESNPGDKRTQLVCLTDQGLQLFDRIAPVHLASEERLLSALEPAEREQLAGLLRKLLFSYEATGSRAPRLWGMRLEPVHTARSRRATVGLSDTHGLLVADVTPASPAADAGLLRGDLIVRANGRTVRHFDHLTLAAEAGRPLHLRLLRGERPITTTLAVPDSSEPTAGRAPPQTP